MGWLSDIAAVALAGLLALPAFAEPRPASCDLLAGALQSFTGYSLGAPPAGNADGWCVFDGARLTAAAADQPDISVRQLRLRGAEDAGMPVALELSAGGIRVTPKIGDTEMDDRLRSLFRLQTADLDLSVSRNETDDRLEIRGGRLVLSGGTEVGFGADVAGARILAASALVGRVTALDLTWKNDGRLLRPVMEAAGERLVEGAEGSAAVDAARSALAAFAGALPVESLTGSSGDEIERLVAAMPQGRGRLQLAFAASAGIGAAQLAIAALSDDPLGPETLARLFQGSTITVDWQAGIVP